MQYCFLYSINLYVVPKYHVRLIVGVKLKVLLFLTLSLIFQFRFLIVQVRKLCTFCLLLFLMVKIFQENKRGVDIVYIIYEC